MKNAFLILLVVFLIGCAGKLPVPGGSDAVSGNCFKSLQDMETHLASLLPGMAEDKVISGLCHKKDGLTKLERRDVRIALLGGDSIPFSSTQPDSEMGLMHSLYGYKLNFKNVHRKHGFSSPIRIRTDETGYSYTVTLIFREGKLFERPLLSGGLVNNTSSGTIFDFLTPGTLIEHTLP